MQRFAANEAIATFPFI